MNSSDRIGAAHSNLKDGVQHMCGSELSGKSRAWSISDEFFAGEHIKVCSGASDAAPRCRQNGNDEAAAQTIASIRVAATLLIWFAMATSPLPVWR